MNQSEVIQALSAQNRSPQTAFQILKSISVLLAERSDDPDIQALLIRSLEHRDDFKACAALLNALLRETGLYPYAEPELLSTRDRLAFEFHRPEGILGAAGFVFHRVQAQIYWRLMDGENVILSAPTSFGKSLIIDALVASGKYQRIAVVVPTIALIDETRKRLIRFSENYKIITHASQSSNEGRGAIFVLTQERVIERDDFEDLDLFVIDEFYKLDPGGGGEDRSAILNHAFYKLLKVSNQFYLLGPNIRTVPLEFQDRFEARLVVSDYATVVSDVRKVDLSGGIRAAPVRLALTLNEPTLIYWPVTWKRSPGNQPSRRTGGYVTGRDSFRSRRLDR